MRFWLSDTNSLILTIKLIVVKINIHSSCEIEDFVETHTVQANCV